MDREKYFYEAFEGMKRLGPGSAASTRRAMDFFPPKSGIKILDVGCGAGTHTLMLAEHFPEADITAIDTHAPHIDGLNREADEKGISHRVRGKVMSMFEMSFDDETFDLIWAEGSIYIAGFVRGIRDWKRLLKKGGYIVCSEISWLKENPSEESKAFWNAGYADMNTITGKIEQIQREGYAFKGCFVCPVSDWTENYYDQIEENLRKMEARYGADSPAVETVSGLRQEIRLYHIHPDDYSYVFYAMEK